MHHVELQPKALDALDMAGEDVGRPLIGIALGVDAHVLQPQLRQLLEVAIATPRELVTPHLRADVHCPLQYYDFAKGV